MYDVVLCVLCIIICTPYDMYYLLCNTKKVAEKVVVDCTIHRYIQ